MCTTPRTRRARWSGASRRTATMVGERRAAVRRSLLTAFMSVRASSRFWRRRLAPADAFCRPMKPRVTKPSTTVISDTVTMSSTSVIPRSDEPRRAPLAEDHEPRGAHHWTSPSGSRARAGSGASSPCWSFRTPRRLQLPYGSATVRFPEASVVAERVMVWVGQPVSVTFFAVTATFGRAAPNVLRVWTIIVCSGTEADDVPPGVTGVRRRSACTRIDRDGAVHAPRGPRPGSSRRTSRSRPRTGRGRAALRRARAGARERLLPAGNRWVLASVTGMLAGIAPARAACEA